MKILVLGTGGREHALAHTFNRQGHQVYCLPGNGGTDRFCQPVEPEWKSIHLAQHDRLLSFVTTHQIDLVVVGPEAPLEKGIVDFFESHSVNIFGPTQKGATLESSKTKAKEFMHKYSIPTAESVSCNHSKEALDAIHRLFPKWKGLVIKPDGLTAGKGVTLCYNLQDAHTTIDLMMEVGKYGLAGSRIVIEEMMTGPEVSILAFSDGNTMVPMIPSQDHKRLSEGDKGPNTGGVGAYAPLPFLNQKDLDLIHSEIIEKTNQGLQREGINYKGILYFGIMLTPNGPKVLEFNCRFGDPEAQVVLPLLESDLAETMMACINGELHTQLPLRWKPQSACGVVLYSKGYPGEYQSGFPITGVEEVGQLPTTHVFHAGTKTKGEDGFVTAGGRVLTVTALGDTLPECIEKAYRGVECIHFDGATFRKDIAYQACK